MASQNKGNEKVAGQKNAGKGSVKAVTGGPNPPVVRPAGATQSGKTGKFSKGKK